MYAIHTATSRLRLYGDRSITRYRKKLIEVALPYLTSLMDARIEVTLEIRADVPDGVPDNVVRTVTENCRTLKFSNHGFEKE